MVGLRKHGGYARHEGVKQHMIELIHKYPILIKTLLGITTLAFVATGGFLWNANKGPGTYIAKVEGESIPDSEYQALASRYEEFYSNLYQGELPQQMKDQLDKKALDELIDRRLILLEMDDMGITVSDKQVSETIVQNPTFQNDAGVFDKQRYLSLLQQNGLSPKSYEESVRRDLAVTLFRNMVKETAAVTDEEAKGYYKDQLAAMGAAFDEKKFEEQKDNIKKKLKVSKENAVLASVMDELRSSYEVEINPQYAQVEEPQQVPMQAQQPQPAGGEKAAPTAPAGGEGSAPTTEPPTK